MRGSAAPFLEGGPYAGLDPFFYVVAYARNCTGKAPGVRVAHSAASRRTNRWPCAPRRRHPVLQGAALQRRQEPPGRPPHAHAGARLRQPRDRGESPHISAHATSSAAFVPVHSRIADPWSVAQLCAGGPGRERHHRLPHRGGHRRRRGRAQLGARRRQRAAGQARAGPGRHHERGAPPRRPASRRKPWLARVRVDAASRTRQPARRRWTRRHAAWRSPAWPWDAPRRSCLSGRPRTTPVEAARAAFAGRRLAASAWARRPGTALRRRGRRPTAAPRRRRGPPTRERRNALTACAGLVELTQ